MGSSGRGYGRRGGGFSSSGYQSSVTTDDPDKFKAKIDKLYAQDNQIRKEIEKATKKEETQSLQKLLTDVPEASLEGLIVGALCAAMPAAVPVIVPLYKMYQLGKAGKEVMDAYQNTKGSEQDKTDAATVEASKQAVKFIAGEVIGKVVEPEAEKISDSIVSTASNAGVIKDIAQTTKVDEVIFSDILKGSLKEGLTNGLSELGTFIVTGGK